MMRKLAFAALGLITRAGRSFARLGGTAKTNPAANRKKGKSPATPKSSRRSVALAKQH